MQEFQRRMNELHTIAPVSRIVAEKVASRGAVSRLESFSYVVNVITTPQSTTEVVTDIHADSDFLLIAITGAAVNVSAGTDRLIVPFGALINFTDKTSNRSLFSAPIFAGLIAGPGGNPYILQETKLLYAKTRFVSSVSNILVAGAGNNTTYQFNFVGLKIFYGGH